MAKRLDRVLCNAHARLKWQEAVVKHLPYMSSDHAPMFVQLDLSLVGNPKRRPFRFEAAWLKHPSFKDLLVSSWDGEMETPRALVSLQAKLRK